MTIENAKSNKKIKLIFAIVFAIFISYHGNQWRQRQALNSITVEDINKAQEHHANNTKKQIFVKDNDKLVKSTQKIPIDKVNSVTQEPKKNDEEYRSRSKENESEKRIPSRIIVEIRTTLGIITLLMAPQIAPKTVENFVGLADGTKKSKNPEWRQLESIHFYDGITIHRVVHKYFIQMGTPYKDGTGGAGFLIPDEFNTKAFDIKPGMVIMATAGAGTASSQFFITVSDMKGMLDDKNTVFGHVIKGYDTVKKISDVRTNSNDQPLDEIKIIEIKIRNIYAKKTEPLDRGADNSLNRF
jgi:peptidyl-prolyl cis-trans isomerase A (cyclophilin A)